MKFIELKKHIQSGALSPVYWLVGEDGRVAERARDMLLRKVDALPEFNITQFDENASLPEVEACCRSFPLQSQYRAVVVRGCKSPLDALKNYFASPQPSTILIFVSSEMTSNFSPYLKSVTVVECGRLPRATLTAFIAKRAASANARISLAEQVKTIVREEFSRALEASAYEAATGGYLKDVFFSAVENLTLSGVAIRQSYVQRLLERNELSERVYYRAYVLASIEQKDFTRLVQAAFNDTKQQVAANKSAKDLAAVTEKRFWQQQQSIANAYE